MKYVRQFLIILMVSLLGEALRFVLPFPIPASVYGLVLMLSALGLKIIQVEQVWDTSQFLFSIMPMMFIPSGVGLIVAWPLLKPVILPVGIITVLTTLIVMVVTGKTVQWMGHVLRRKEQ
ncbi:MAG: CidA/LrgA family protein [Eubacteriales bacterium]|nr:CidA/LrgA family protein [Eubacteriales bacterium]